jgi:hypothetical protein
MQNSKGVHRDSSATILNAIGGEPLAGSGFDTEYPAPDSYAGEEAKRSSDDTANTTKIHRTTVHRLASTAGLPPRSHGQHCSNVGAWHRCVTETLGGWDPVPSACLPI